MTSDNGQRPPSYPPPQPINTHTPPNTMFCKHCGMVIDKDCVICTSCGKQVGTLTQTKYCKFCGSVIDIECVVCPKCGKQIEELRTTSSQPQQQYTTGQPNIVINNTANSGAYGGMYLPLGNPRDKWVALLLLLFLGFFGAHKFYEGRIGMGILYIFTGGLFGVGLVIDFFAILFKPNPYYV